MTKEEIINYLSEEKSDLIEVKNKFIDLKEDVYKRIRFLTLTNIVSVLVNIFAGTFQIRLYHHFLASINIAFGVICTVTYFSVVIKLIQNYNRCAEVINNIEIDIDDIESKVIILKERDEYAISEKK